MSNLSQKLAMLSRTITATSLCILLVCIFTIIMLPNNTYAQTTSKNIKGLTLSPLRSEIEITPGTSIDGTLTVINSTNKSMTVKLSAEEFSVINQQYDYAFTVESNVSKWVTFDTPSVDLAAGQSVKVKYLIGVPVSSEPGGRYISLFASTTNNDQQTGINSEQRIASLLYINVSGDVSRSGHLISLNTPWVVGGPGKWSMAIQNTGTTHFRSRYSIQTYNLFNTKVANDVSGEALILPGSIRLVSSGLLLPQFPGLYKVVYKIGLGDTPSKTVMRLMLYLPLWSVLIVLIVVVMVIVVLARRSKSNVKFSRFVEQLYKRH